MDKKIKKEWVKALRSGKYKKCRYQLHSQMGAHCALGVLHIVVAKIKKKGLSKITNLLVNKVSKLEDGFDIVHLNDDRDKSFEEIADYIEENR